MGFDHAMIGGLLAKHWGLSPVLRSILEHHHNPKDDKKFFELTELMAGAHGLVCEAGFTHNGQKTDRASLEALEKLNLPPEQVAVILQVITNEIEKTCADLMVAA